MQRPSTGFSLPPAGQPLHSPTWAGATRPAISALARVDFIATPG